MWAGRQCRSLLLRWLLAVLATGWALQLGTPAAAQDSQAQQSSVADAARRAKQKKNSASKAPKVIDDDNLSSTVRTGGPDTTNSGASTAATVNPGAPSTETSAGTETPATNQAANQDDQSAADQDAEVAKAKEEVAKIEQELDLLKRGFALDSEAYYSKADYSTDKAGKAKLDSERQQIADKQQELDQAKARLAALLEERSRRKGKSAGPSANEPEKP